VDFYCQPICAGPLQFGIVVNDLPSELSDLLVFAGGLTLPLLIGFDNRVFLYFRTFFRLLDQRCVL
jgi:hypothetical protein